MKNITYLLRYANRNDWQPNTALPRLGDKVNRFLRTEAFVHHTVVVDTDVTKNIWESDAECFAQMRRLQVIRPDLGLDVPYNYVGFPTFKNGFPALLVCEGRGRDRSGAHTKYHNDTGIAVAVQGDWEHTIESFSGWINHVGRFFSWLRYEQWVLGNLSNLGTVRPSHSRDLWGHRDVYGTACPGKQIYNVLQVPVIKNWSVGV